MPEAQLIPTEYGTVRVDTPEGLFQTCVEQIRAVASKQLLHRPAVIGLTGGSTPKAFYQWVTDHQALLADEIASIVWTVSDERHVPLESPDSNFGEANRRLLQPLGVSDSKKLPWPVQVDPHSAAALFNRGWSEQFGLGHGFDLCYLGMGDDGHTASLFPGSPLLGAHVADDFACVEVPDKGWRQTITEVGLKRSESIVVLVMGERKAAMLKSVLQGPDGQYPIQILKEHAPRVTWLVDHAAAAAL